jgi:hypothetical protein
MAGRFEGLSDVEWLCFARKVGILLANSKVPKCVYPTCLL